MRMDGELVKAILEPLTQDELLQFIRKLESSNQRLIKEQHRIKGADSLIAEMWPFYRVATWRIL